MINKIYYAVTVLAAISIIVLPKSAMGENLNLLENKGFSSIDGSKKSSKILKKTYHGGRTCFYNPITKKWWCIPG